MPFGEKILAKSLLFLFFGTARVPLGPRFPGWVPHRARRGPTLDQNGMKIPPSLPRIVRAAALIIACVISFSAAQSGGDVPEPMPVPNGDTSFVGSLKVSFTTLVLHPGTIFYTLDGTAPTEKSAKYNEPFEIAKTTTLKAVRIAQGKSSQVHTAQFIRRKLPAISARYGGKPDFVGSTKCTLSVTVAPPLSVPPKILYSVDGGAAQPYAAPISITTSASLTAYATHADYDNSPNTVVNFKLLAPVEKPVMDKKTQTFAANPLRVKFSTATSGAYFQYTLGATGNPDTGTLADSVVLVGSVPGEIITLRVIAKKAGMAHSAVAEEKYTYMPPVATPVPTPPPTFFHDSITISLATTTTGATMYYTLDGNTLPSQSTNEYKNKLFIDSTITLKAMAFKVNQTNSAIFSGAYTLNLSPPTSNRASGEFVDSLKVTLRSKSPSAQILFTLDGKDPSRSSSPFNPKDTIVLTKDSTELRAITVKGSVMSPVARFSYVKRSSITTTPAPVIEPAGRDFLDSQWVTLVPPDAESKVYFTLDGTEPNLKSPQYLSSFTIKATTVIKAIARKPGLDSSGTRQERFVLIPSIPIANPPATQPFPNRVDVQLTSKTEGAVIKYMLGDKKWNDTLAATVPASGLVFVADEKLQAAAVVGTGPNKRVSEVLTQFYVVYASNPSDTLAAGKVRAVSGGFSLSNQGSTPVIAKLGSFENLDLGGFRDASHSVILSAVEGKAFPKVDFMKPADQTHAVYRIGAGGRPEFVGNGTAVEILKAGTYFAAVDTQAPVILLVDQSPKAGEATTFKLQVIDNVAFTACDVKGSGLGDAKLSRHADIDGFLSFSLKNAANEVKNLWFQAQAYDAFNTTRFPAGAAEKYYLEQVWSKLTTPAAWIMGGGAEKPWDLAGFPVGASSSLSWGQIRVDNPDPALTTITFRDGGYVTLKDADMIEPGMAFWLGSQNSRSTLSLSKFRSSRSDADGRFRVTVHPGWNLVTNPTLERMYWPAARSDADKYRQSLLRGLWCYPNDLKDYLPSDSLDPWNGYWVYYYGDKDTSVALLTARAPAPKVAAGSEAGKVEILIDFGRPFPIRLGARSYAKDGVGVEDEPQLPAWNRTRQAWTVRDRSRLMTDVLHFEPDQVMRWKLVLEGAPAEGQDSMVTVAESHLPDGFEAWAWSPRRNLKVRLDLNAGYSLPGIGPDTLVILAGPAAKMAILPELARAVESVTDFASGPRSGRQGQDLFLALPSDALVKADLWSLSGRHLARIHMGRLGSGQHRLALPHSTGTRGIALIRLQVRGQGWSADRVHKIAW